MTTDPVCAATAEELAAAEVVVIGGGPAPGADAAAVAREIADRLPPGRPWRVLLVAQTADGPDDEPFPVPAQRVGSVLLDWAARGLTWEQTRAALGVVRDRLRDVDGPAALRRRGIAVTAGRVTLLGRGRLALDVGGDTHLISPHRVVIATGATPVVPDVAGLLDTSFVTSATVLDLLELPSSLAVLGAGSLGCELAQGFARMGSTVTLIDAASGVLPDDDPAAGWLVDRALREDAVRIMLDATVVKVAPTLDGGAWVGTALGASVGSVAGTGVGTVAGAVAGEGRDGGSGARGRARSGGVAAEVFVLAMGRRPRTAGLNLSAAGIELTLDGAIRVDDRLRTASPEVLAMGEVTGLPAYGAAPGPMARVAAVNVLSHRPGLRWATPTAARVTRTEPEVVQIGQVSREPDDGSCVGESDGPTPGSFVSVVVGLSAGRDVPGLGGPSHRVVLAATLVGPGAAHAATQLVLAANVNLPAASLIDTVAPDGTWSAAVQVAVARALTAPHP